MVGEVMAYALLHAANPKLATVVALGDRDRPAAIERALRHEQPAGDRLKTRVAIPPAKK